jgi:hypothetical protein
MGFSGDWGVCGRCHKHADVCYYSSDRFQYSVATDWGGILFAVAYETSGSLAAPIVIHVLGNLAIFTVSLISLTAL